MEEVREEEVICTRSGGGWMTGGWVTFRQEFSQLLTGCEGEKVGEWSGARLHAELDISGSWRRDIFGDTVPISEARLEDLDLSLGDLKSLDLGGMAGA